MNAPVCLKCHMTMRCHRTGADLELMTGEGGYQIWNADVFRCEHCGAMTATGFGAKPIAESYQSEYQALRKQCRPTRYWSTLREKEQWEDEYGLRFPVAGEAATR